MKYKYEKDNLDKDIEHVRNNIPEVIKIDFNSKDKKINITYSSKKFQFSAYYPISLDVINRSFLNGEIEIFYSPFLSSSKLLQILQSFDESYNHYKHNNKLAIYNYFKDLNEYLESSEYIRKEFKLSYQNKTLDQFFNKKNSISITLFLNLFSLAIKSIVGIQAYSPYSVNQNYSLFNHQINMMSTISNLNISSWYNLNDTLLNLDTYSNESFVLDKEKLNNLWSYKILPVKAYHKFIMGKILNYINPNIMTQNLNDIPSTYTIFILRTVAIISDILIYHLGATLFSKAFCLDLKRKKSYSKYFILLSLLLLSPLMIIFDHGLYTFSNTILGLFLLSLFFLLKKKIILSIFIYCLCVNYDLTGLHYFLPFILYIIKHLISRKNLSFVKKLLSFLIYIFTFAISIILIWYPWLKFDKIEENIHILKKIFPLKINILKDKSPNFWYHFNNFYGLSKMSEKSIIKLALYLLILSSLVPLLSITFSRKKSSFKIAKLSFFSMSIGMYLFFPYENMYSISLPYLAFLLCAFEMRKLLTSFSILALFTLYPILKKEKYELTYWVMMIFAFLISKEMKKMICIIKDEKKTQNEVVNNEENRTNFKIWEFFDFLNVCLILIYHFGENYIMNDEKYTKYIKYSNNLVISNIDAYGCFAYFSFAFIYSNIKILLYLK